MKKAFTLAEVLITITIIGVVAAMTIPTLINTYKVKVLENQFKKTNSILQQALTRSLVEIGYNDVTELNIPGRHVTNENYAELKDNVDRLNEVWINQFVGAKKFDRSYLNSKKITCYDISGVRLSGGCSCLFPAGNDGSYMLVDGILVSKLFAYYGGINHPGIIRFVFDINGPEKGPNRWGHDIFQYNSVADYNECNPVRGSSHRNEGCYYWASRNINPIEKSKYYWSMLYKSKSYFE